MTKQQERRRYPRVTHPGGEETPIRFELFSTERLEQHAVSLAHAQKSSPQKEGQKLIPRVHENSRVLLAAYQTLHKATQEQHAITPAAEWVLDNFHIIDEQVSNILSDLPENYYVELPKLVDGVLAGYPRVYGIAWALVAHTDSRFAPDLLTHFIKAYQSVDPLTLGELWAIPITLRVLLIENLRRFAVRIMRAQAGRLLADEFVNQIEHLSVQSDKSSEQAFQGSLPVAALRQAYVVQILQRLHDPHPSATISLDFLNEWLAEQKLSIDEIVNREHAAQIANNLTVRNIITSMRAISTFDWSQFVEEVSLVDQCLRAHDSYKAMDFLTRDRYRHAIEDLAKRSNYSELEIAHRVSDKVQHNNEHAIEERQREPGYYLIGAGRYEFEKTLNFQPTVRQRLLRAYIAHAGIAYIASIGLLTLLLLALPLTISFTAGITHYQLILLALCLVFPASDIAVNVMNRFIIGKLPPRHIPRLDLKEGIPETLSTFVVVPTLFVNIANVKEQIRQMEIRYLSNPDQQVRFALLSDWIDADQEMLPNDELLLNTAQTAVAELNTQYGAQRFFIFHRKRLWNPCEGKWMGWERKRGKLHEFNRLLRGATDTSFLPIAGHPAVAPSGICYVITLDADTKLPMGVVAQLVGVAAHPLNCPVFNAVDQCVVEGYGILQPRMTPTLPIRQEHSLFYQFFAGVSGTDAYASSVSELYQDLFALGTYSGKGLYHVDAFEAALAERVPENTQLSHDLFESVYARCALVSDIEFFEEFPSHTDVAASREHRWTRGDWQLLPWIFGPRGKGMPLIGRWKMIDNLRRSLSAPGAFFALVALWSMPNAPHFMLMGIVLTALAFPVILAIVSGFALPRRGTSLLTHIRTFIENVLSASANSLVALTLLAQHTWLMMDAIISTLFRLLITKRQMLKWVTALQAKSASSHTLKNLTRPTYRSIAMVVSVAIVVLLCNPAGIALAAPFLLLWLLAPLIAHALSLPPKIDRAEALLPEDSEQLRLIGRRIWYFFTTFVTEADHCLPPDNFQEDPQPVIAHRSSPTNFGLYLMSIMTARDFGWLGVMDTVDKLDATLITLAELPRLHGHFYNWYDTSDLHILEPRYISTVDSGNLAGHLLTIGQACRELLNQPISLPNALTGLMDTHQLFMGSLVEIADDRRTNIVTLRELRQKGLVIKELLASSPIDSHAWCYLWRRLTGCADILQDLARVYATERDDTDDSEVLALATLLRHDIYSHVRDIDNLMPWIHCSIPLSAVDVESKTQHPLPIVPATQLTLDTHLNNLSSNYAQYLADLNTLPQNALKSNAIEAHLVLLQNAGVQADILTQRLNNIIAKVDNLFHDMDFSFLYDKNCHMFAIGYRVAEDVLDPSYYDLLASEARLSSFIAIAKRDVPSTHWFHLGRRVTRAAQGTVLLSWSGSMFEYLMPSLVMYTPRYSLLDQTCRLVVKRQIEYGHERGVPWGVSESAFNGRDLFFTYQYSAFGVPGLGIKRGLGEELVIAPYATALAAMYLPHAAVKNLERLQQEGALGRFGFYEALDFTPIRLAENQRVAVVRCYMAHHQGMSLVAIGNVVHDGIMRHHFHNAALIQSAALLLQERIPSGDDVINTPLLEVLAEVKESVHPPVRRVPSPTSAVPTAHLLSNGRYAVMMTAAGSGYSLWRNLAVTRWREDVTRDAWGSFIYLRDTDSGQVWSAGYQPTTIEPDKYDVFFAEDRVRINRIDGYIASTLEIVISPEDDAEIRRLSLTNTGTHPREIEITSYAEIVLAPLAADIAHPVFSNLFIKTEYLPQVQGLLAQRRPRMVNDPSSWAAHLLIGRQSNGGLQFETDRGRFIGRGQTLQAPVAVIDGRPLTNTVGYVLDPIFSLRTKLHIAPGATEHITFTTLVADTRLALEEAVDKYHNLAAFERVSSLAWTHAHVQLRHLRTQPDEAQLFQDLVGRLLYSDPWLRPSSQFMQMNTLSVTELWRQGISGDNPIILLRVTESEDRMIVEQLLRAHEYWRMKGLAVDLVILNEKESSYAGDLQTLLENMVRDKLAIFNPTAYDARSAIFVVRGEQLSLEGRLLLKTAARVILASKRGTLAEQLLRHPRPVAAFVAPKALPLPGSVSPKLTTPPLEFFNGLGGFDDNGREYVIVLDNNQWTPVPWVNVIANSEFGFIVSEAGSSCTWSLNSRENQLTPWSNDPICDPSGEMFYLRDDDTNELWTPTALPIRIDNASYIIRHGYGYSRFEHESHGIHSELVQFVSPDDPIKISTLTLTNNSNRPRRLTIAAYVKWVLGASRSVTASHIITELDPETQAIFAYNSWSAEFGHRIAFADFAGQQTAWTGNRAEFIGRNGNLSAPAGLLNSHPLKNRLGAGLDPCAALTTAVELKANESIELVFLLGQGRDRHHARELIKYHRTTQAATTFNQVKQSWQKILGKVQVKTPDRELDLLLNGWLLYQTLSCRMWARAGFYQVGGAFGFRDQLQDSMALAVARPDLTREHLLRAAARQFAEGDVQHWWHPPSGRGVRTHFSDDRIWLPYVVAHYLKVSGDTNILNESVSFLEGPVLAIDQEDAYFEPGLSQQHATLFEHCARALDLSLATGIHGLPLMGSGDWNDGMNRIGHQGKGESVWLAWFLITTLSEFANIADSYGDNEHAMRWREHVGQLKAALEKEAWDGAWYRRAYFDDGSPLGSAANAECRIDSIAQSWGVISGAADSDRAQRAMASVRDYLVRHSDDLILLFTPPFDKTDRDPGYIKSYPPGIRENGGQYTHAAIWSVIAYAMLGDGDQAAELLRMLNPINRTATRTGIYAYKVEPYVLAADIYAEAPHTRRGGWTWYTGASGWYYRTGLEWVLGLQVRANTLVFDPCIPKAWRNYSLVYQHGNSAYEINIDNPNGVSRGVIQVELDGQKQRNANSISLSDNGQHHQVRVLLG